MCDGAEYEARRVHEDRGDKDELGGGGVFVSKPAEGRDLHATCSVGPPAAHTRGVWECSVWHASVVCLGHGKPQAESALDP